MQCIDGSIARRRVPLVLGQISPFLNEELQVTVDVLLELTDVLGAEGVADDFSLAGVFGAVASIE